MIRYEVMSESQAMQERFSLLREGEYDAVIVKSEDKQSSTGNPMMDMTLSVYDDNGLTHLVRDFLVFTKSMMWKVIHCAESADVVKEYEKQKFCSDLMVGKKVKVKVVIEEGKMIPEEKLNGKAYGSRYPDKNRIDDYLKEGGVSKVNLIEDDDIMF